MHKNGLNFFKGFHLVAVSCWIGGSVAFILQYLYMVDINNGGMISGINQPINYHSDILIFMFTGAVGCLLTGLIYGTFSNWGFFKHRWIQLKWIICTPTILLGIFFLSPWKSHITQMSGALGMTVLTAYLYNPKIILIFCGFQTLLLVVTVFIATVKPWEKRERNTRAKSLSKPETATIYHRKWFVATAVGTGVFLATLDSSIVNVSLPTMVKSLNTNFTLIQWVVLAYLLTVTTLMLGFGKLGDIFGKKRIYLLGFSIFTFASTLCGFAFNVHFLIAFRIVQGIGAAMIMALGAAILTESFPPNERGKAMGIIGAIVSIGIVAGPVLGGIIVDFLSWHWIFFVNIPTGICGTWMIWHFIPNLNPSQKQRFDYYGALILFASLICLLIGLSLGQQHGFTYWPVLILLLAAFISIMGFIMVELRVDQPMIHLSLFQNPQLCVNLLTGFITFVSIGGVFILIPFYLEIILGFQTAKVGLLMGVIPIMMGIFAPIAGTLSDHLGSRPITLLGLAILFCGYLAASTLSTHTDELGFILRIIGIGVGMGLFISPNNSAIMGAGAKNQLGIVSGLMAISRTLGQTVGVSVIGTLWAVRIRTLTGNWDLADVTQAPIFWQVKGLQFIIIVVAVMILVSFCISVYGYLLDQKIQKTDQNWSPQ